MPDTRELREAVERVKRHRSHGQFVSGVRATIDRQRWLRVMGYDPHGREIELLFVPYGDRTTDEHDCATWTARFAALCSPDRILALLDALDAALKAKEAAERSLWAVADFVESHWRGAGLPLSHEWIIQELKGWGEELTAEGERAEAAERESDEANASIKALEEKIAALASHETCACSWDQPGDLCAHHSPGLIAAEAREREARAKALEEAYDAVRKRYRDWNEGRYGDDEPLNYHDFLDAIRALTPTADPAHAGGPSP